MEKKPSMYVGASSHHIHCENFNFEPDSPLKIFKRDEICPQFTWLDIRNCLGIFHKNTFKNLPNLKFLNIDKSNFEQIQEKTFSNLNNLQSLDIRKSNFPLKEDTLENCEKLENLRIIALKNEISTQKVFKSLRKLNDLTLDHFSVLNLEKETFTGLRNLKYLFIQCSTINIFHLDALKNLESLENLYLTNNTFENFDINSILSLNTLKTLGFTGNKLKEPRELKVEYQKFENLPVLEKINFPQEEIKKLDFEGFKSLVKVILTIGESQKEEDIIKFLEGKNIAFEWISNSDLIEEIDFSNPNIMICA